MIRNDFGMTIGVEGKSHSSSLLSVLLSLSLSSPNNFFAACGVIKRFGGPANPGPLLPLELDPSHISSSNIIALERSITTNKSL